MYTAPLAVLVVFAGWGIPIAIGRITSGPVVLALLLAPIVCSGFALTAGLSPEYWVLTIRSQTFVHLSVITMAAIGAIGLGRQLGPRALPLIKPALPMVLIICALVSAPLAFAGLPVFPYESTTTTGQFQAVTFATEQFNGNWTSDDHLTRVGSNYYDIGASPGPTYEWMEDGTVPSCPVIVQESWSKTGVQAFPTEPIATDSDQLLQFQVQNHVVYHGGSSTQQRIIIPSGGSGSC